MFSGRRPGFMPLFAPSTVEGRLFVLLDIAYIILILPALFVSLTVTRGLPHYSDFCSNSANNFCKAADSVGLTK